MPPVPQVIVNEETAHETEDFITKRLSAIKNQRSTGDLEDLALIIGLHCVLFIPTPLPDFHSYRWKESHLRPREGDFEVIFGACDFVQGGHLL